MKKVIFVEVTDNDDYYDSVRWRDNTEWLEITDEDYEFYRNNLYRINSYPTYYRMITYVEPEALVNLRTKIEEQAAKYKAREQAAAAAAEKRRQQAAEKKQESKRKQLERLKRELGEA